MLGCLKRCSPADVCSSVQTIYVRLIVSHSPCRASCIVLVPQSFVEGGRFSLPTRTEALHGECLSKSQITQNLSQVKTSALPAVYFNHMCNIQNNKHIYSLLHSWYCIFLFNTFMAKKCPKAFRKRRESAPSDNTSTTSSPGHCL